MLYPKMNDARALLDLSGVWDFLLDDGTGFINRWFEGKLTDPQTIAVPASYNDQKEGADFRDHCGWAFYQREVSLPRQLLGERVVLRFGAVTNAARIYWNGEQIGAHKGGFLPFEIELGEKVKPGANLLTVAVDNRVDSGTLPVGSETAGNMQSGPEAEIPGVQRRKQNYPNFDFFNYAGIHRPVKIYTTPKAYIKDVTFVSRVIGDDAQVGYEVETHGGGAVRLVIFDEAGAEVARAAGEKGVFTIRKARLWQPLDAYLYTARITFGGDCYSQTFGVRTVEVKGAQFLINGRPFYFKGFGKHEDSEIHGRGLDEALNVKDISLMKWIGANSFRTSHYPYSEEMMNLCDREGIVVIAETPAVGLNINMHGDTGVDTFSVMHTAEHHREVVRDMIARDKNHPCVVLWSLANEADTTAFPDSAVAYFKPLYELAHRLDPENRPVTIVDVQNDYLKDKTVPMMDVICLNRYYGWYTFAGDLDAAMQALAIELDYWQTFDKPVMFTEYGTDTVAGLHLATPTMFCEEYQLEFYRRVSGVIDRYDCFVGEQVWNFADFATVQGILRVDGNKKGIFTRDRRPKLAAHFLKARWSRADFGQRGI